jgi:hypothetical protein
VPDSAFRRNNRFDDEDPSSPAQQRQCCPRGLLRPPSRAAWRVTDGHLGSARRGDRGPEPYPRGWSQSLPRVGHRACVAEVRAGAGSLPWSAGGVPPVPGRPPDGRQALPGRLAPDVPPGQLVPGGPPGAPVPRQPGHGQGHRGRPADDRRPVGQSRVRRAMPAAQAGVPVPYPVQLLGTEVMQEFIGEDDGTAAPRLAETRPDPPSWPGCGGSWSRALTTLAGLGLAHGDLSAYNLLVHRGRLIMIDLPQVVDVIANPAARSSLERGRRQRGARWFHRPWPDADPPGPPPPPGGERGWPGRAPVPGLSVAEGPPPLKDLGFYFLTSRRVAWCRGQLAAGTTSPLRTLPRLAGGPPAPPLAEARPRRAGGGGHGREILAPVTAPPREPQ